MEDEELVNMMSFYDYIEVQPLSVFSHLIGIDRKFNNEIDKKYVDNVMPSLVDKWNINFIDLLNYNPSCDLYLKVDTSSSSGYFYDDIHPNFIGYSALMYPLINEYLFNLFK